jgi:hypothetical protein
VKKEVKLETKKKKTGSTNEINMERNAGKKEGGERERE